MNVKTFSLMAGSLISSLTALLIGAMTLLAFYYGNRVGGLNMDNQWRSPPS